MGIAFHKYFAAPGERRNASRSPGRGALSEKRRDESRARKVRRGRHECSPARWAGQEREEYHLHSVLWHGHSCVCWVALRSARAAGRKPTQARMPVPQRYSPRSAVIGSTAVARAAGTDAAPIATTKRRTAATMMVSGSVGWMPKSNPFRKLD